MEPRSSRPRTATEERALLWIMLAWLGVAVAALSFSGVPEKIRQLRTPYAERAVFDASKEPTPGTPVPLPETDVLGRNIRELAAKAGRVILVVYGGCDDCSARKHAPTMIPREEGDCVIVAWMSHEETVRRRARSYSKDIVTIADPEGAVARKLHAFWLPRAYILDQSLKVTASQPYGVGLGEWVSEQ